MYNFMEALFFNYETVTMKTSGTAYYQHIFYTQSQTATQKNQLSASYQEHNMSKEGTTSPQNNETDHAFPQMGNKKD